MKFTTYTTFPEQTSNESLWILVDSEQLQSNLNTYQINNLESILTATQFKANVRFDLILHLRHRCAAVIHLQNFEAYVSQFFRYHISPP